MRIWGMRRTLRQELELEVDTNLFESLLRQREAETALALQALADLRVDRARARLAELEAQDAAEEHARRPLRPLTGPNGLQVQEGRHQPVPEG